MNARKNFARVWTTALLAITAALIPMSSARAKESDCPDDYVCMWEDFDYQGDMWVKHKRPTDGDTWMDIDWWNGDNEISSFVNNTGCELTLNAGNLGYTDDKGRKVFVTTTRVADLRKYNWDLTPGEAITVNDDAQSYSIICY